jgi:hypothetical protein
MKVDIFLERPLGRRSFEEKILKAVPFTGDPRREQDCIAFRRRVQEENPGWVIKAVNVRDDSEAT